MDDKKRSYYNAQGKLVLPQVTLCAMDSVQVRATLKAMEYSMKDIVFADAVIITDKKPLFITYSLIRISLFKHVVYCV